MTPIVNEPGLVKGLPESDYHSDPVEAGSLSSTEAKTILKSPAHLKHYRETRREPKPVFDFGSAVHTLALGTGWPIRKLDFGSFRTKDAQQARDETYAANEIPVLAATYEQVLRVADAIFDHPVAGPLFSRDDSEVEVSAFGQHDSGVWLRGRFDLLLPDAGIIVDLKTTVSADPRDFARTAYTLGYDVQNAHYRAAYALATGNEPASFINVLVEKEPPYLVSVVELDRDFTTLGKGRHERAIARYKHATETGQWPGYPADQVHQIAPEIWMERKEEDHEEEQAA